MKRFCFLLFVLSTSLFVTAQMHVNIGNDTTFCESSFSEAKLGTNIKIEGGTPPYTYRWIAEINAYGHTYSADMFLDDPTLETPIFKGNWGSPEWESFILEVTDANNEVAKDTIRVRFSTFAFLEGYQVLFQNVGDEIDLSWGGVIGGGILPYQSYSWSPADDLLTPHSPNTICKVTKSATYTITVEDSAGCQASNVVCEIRVPTSGFFDLESPKVAPYLSNKILYWENSQNLPAKLEIVDMGGKKIKEIHITQNEYSFAFDSHDLPLRGVYILTIGEKRYSGKY